LKKINKQFLSIAFILAYVCFGIIAYTNTGFGEVFRNPLLLTLLTIGFLSPFISSLIVYIINKDELGGLSGFMENFKITNSVTSIGMVFVLLAAHYGFGIILKNVGVYGTFLDFFKYLPIMIVFMGLQEIGWRRIVQPHFENERGFYRSVIITGLLWAVWFLPLIFVKGFLILPQFYSQFAGYLVGISFLLTTIYKMTDRISYSIILSSLIFALVPVIVFKQGWLLLAIAVLEVFVSSVLRNKKINT
jgi:hypothetical protein